ncbi:hypothetical protein LPMP_341970 [Leishmania panamensis]|uniref:Uncharacterized protein n=1 Tax=Leishmania panamensis TaxID=5679 RepID=A0A088S0A0_LEIPA|nr:hypothetical protein LPMP_341970 [Leishmania panamensis]AIO01823.1 hypothetical protein LPMP_341970 [Leishmania panamensis]
MAMGCSTEVGEDAGSLGHQRSDEESEFNEGDWEEGEEQDDEFSDETQEGEEEEEEEDEVEEEEAEKERRSSGSSDGDEDADSEGAKGRQEQEGQEEGDSGSNGVLEDDVKTVPPVTTAIGNSGTFAAASLFADLSVGAGSKGSVFGTLATSVEVPPSPQLPTAPSAFSASPLATAPPPQPFSARTTNPFPGPIALQEQKPLNAAPASPFQPAVASAAALQQQQDTITGSLYFVDFERSLGQKLSSSEWHRARSKDGETQDVKRALARYDLVLPTDKFDEQIEKALYGN